MHACKEYLIRNFPNLYEKKPVVVEPTIINYVFEGAANLSKNDIFRMIMSLRIFGLRIGEIILNYSLNSSE